MDGAPGWRARSLARQWDCSRRYARAARRSRRARATSRSTSRRSPRWKRSASRVSTPSATTSRATPDDVAAYLLTLDAINFGSGWFPTLRKRPGCSGYYTVAWALADHWRESGPWTAAELRDLDAATVAGVLGQDPGHELMSLYASALRDLGTFLGERGALELVAEAERIGRAAGVDAGRGHALLRRPRLLQARPDRAQRPRAGRGGRVQRPGPAHDLRRQPRAPRAAGGRRAALRRRRWPPASTPASCSRRARRSARSAPARCTPAS